MPPKKRLKIGSSNAEPCVARSHVQENFGSLPITADEIRNGHILHVYMTSGEFSRAECDRQLKTLFSSKYSFRPAGDYKAGIKRVVSSILEKHRRLGNPEEFRKFKAACEEPFQFPLRVPNSPPDRPTVGDDDDDGVQSGASRNFVDATASHQLGPPPATPVSTPFTPDAATMKSTADTTSSVKTRSKPVTPSKIKRLKTRLSFLSSTSSQSKQRYREQIKALKSQLNTPKRVYNQALRRKMDVIARKDAKIRDLQRQLSGNHLANELMRMNIELARVKNAHLKLIVYHRNKAKRSTTVPTVKYHQTVAKLRDRDETIKRLEYDNLLLREMVEDAENTTGSKTKIDGKTYSSSMRMKVYKCIKNKVPTANVPTLLRELDEPKERQPEESIPQRSAVEMMTRELGSIAELQTAEVILENENVTMGFDATTQEERHVNSIHFTTKTECVCAAVDELAGGTAEDYATHICETVDNLSATYVYFNEGAYYQDVRKKFIEHIANTITDRCASNHAAVRIVNSEWGKSLNELYCHLHPLDSIASAVRSSLKKLEEERGKVFGRDCLAANVILQVNKLRYKNGKGDPRGFVAFLDDNNLPRGILPRYRGNRLHVLFHIAGKLLEHSDLFAMFFSMGTSCGGLRSAVLQDFKSATTQCELHVLGLLGKLLSGPWMKKFYTSAASEMQHIEGIQVVKDIIGRLKEALNDTRALVLAKENFFGEEMAGDDTLTRLQQLPVDPQFEEMMRGCIKAIIQVLERQYAKYFDINVTEKLKEETESARSHNMDAEEIMGMFSSSQQKARNATMDYLSCSMRASKNKTTQYLEKLDEKRRDTILQKVIKYARTQRNKRKVKQAELRAELIRREKAKEHARDTKERKKLEKRLKESDLETVQSEFPNLDYSKSDDIQDILNGRIVGKKACHAWSEDGKLVVYNAKVEKLRLAKMVYKVAYWTQTENYDDDAEDFEMSAYQLAADLLHGDLMFC